eukprot:CAMPEP_0172055604 /NCGR_PEP_ID=MMETSP1043-20130122/5362_1 /TAXON_ID=464988 /ORGANISM="Hemiselmis andersenii, Strain CCMP441" /LENGTH=467 /DNA_ID=CAMNT_0012714999 /DNA_START=9 /DNA_END=1409 /DNA_ORIENTATION=-
MPSDLMFESRFESGNLWKAVRIGESEYNLVLRPDLTTGGCLWFYFLTQNMAKNFTYTFNLVNLYKERSMYSSGLRPLLWSEQEYEGTGRGWHRVGDNISYTENSTRRKNGNNHYTLSFQVRFPHGNDTAFLAMCFPYTYTDLQDFLVGLEKDETSSATFTRSELCRTIGGNRCDLLEITAPPKPGNQITDRQCFVISGRVHPGESNASWMVKGMIQFLTGEGHVARVLREQFVFYVAPMLNPDGVVNGFYRVSLSGQDLNRQWSDPGKSTHPTIYSLKNFVKGLNDEGRLLCYIDVHGHSTKRNVFMYGCTGSDGREKCFPRLFGERCPNFSFKDCRFDVDRSKENTGRVVVYREVGILHSFTLEASFCGAEAPQPPPPSPDIRTGTVPPAPPPLPSYHFNSEDLEQVGTDMIQALAEYATLSDSGWRVSPDYAQHLQDARARDAPGPGASVLDLYLASLKVISKER